MKLRLNLSFFIALTILVLAAAWLASGQLGNKKDNLTEFYDLIYQYKTDCLTASLRYNKEYYSNSTKKPNEELFFNITLIPLGSTQTGSLFDLKKNK